MSRENLWTQTFSGKTFHPFDPVAEEIDITDIAHGLSNTCRFGGQCSRFYSVAQHCCLMTELVPRHAQYWALMHDAAEAYIGDLPLPIKEGMPEFSHVEDEILKVVVDKFEIPITTHIHKVVKQADRWLCALEAQKLMDLPYWADEILNTPHLFNARKIEIKPWTPDKAKTGFILKFVQQKHRQKARIDAQ